MKRCTECNEYIMREVIVNGKVICFDCANEMQLEFTLPTGETSEELFSLANQKNTCLADAYDEIVWGYTYVTPVASGYEAECLNW